MYFQERWLARIAIRPLLCYKERKLYPALLRSSMRPGRQCCLRPRRAAWAPIRLPHGKIRAATKFWHQPLHQQQPCLGCRYACNQALKPLGGHLTTLMQSEIALWLTSASNGFCAAVGVCDLEKQYSGSQPYDTLQREVLNAANGRHEPAHSGFKQMFLKSICQCTL